ncbi:MAG: hypothetical protein AB4426_29695 [Xenococcaceae cyanobacterium]
MGFAKPLRGAFGFAYGFGHQPVGKYNPPLVVLGYLIGLYFVVAKFQPDGRCFLHKWPL